MSLALYCDNLVVVGVKQSQTELITSGVSIKGQLGQWSKEAHLYLNYRMVKEEASWRP